MNTTILLYVSRVALPLLSIFFPVIEIHGNAKSRGVGGPAEKDLGLPTSGRSACPSRVHSVITKLERFPSPFQLLRSECYNLLHVGRGQACNLAINSLEHGVRPAIMQLTF